MTPLTCEATAALHMICSSCYAFPPEQAHLKKVKGMEKIKGIIEWATKPINSDRPDFTVLEEEFGTIVVHQPSITRTQSLNPSARSGGDGDEDAPFLKEMRAHGANGGPANSSSSSNVRGGGASGAGNVDAFRGRELDESSEAFERSMANVIEDDEENDRTGEYFNVIKPGGGPLDRPHKDSNV